MNFQERQAIAQELLVVQAMCRSAESNLGIESVAVAVVIEHVEQARRKLRAVASMLQPPERMSWKTKRRLPRYVDDVILPVGTDVTLVEPLDRAKGIWIAEAHLPDDTLVGGYSHQTLQVNIAADLE